MVGGRGGRTDPKKAVKLLLLGAGLDIHSIDKLRFTRPKSIVLPLTCCGTRPVSVLTDKQPFAGGSGSDDHGLIDYNGVTRLRRS